MKRKTFLMGALLIAALIPSASQAIASNIIGSAKTRNIMTAAERITTVELIAGRIEIDDRISINERISSSPVE